MKKNILLLSYYSSYGPQDTLDEYFSKKQNFRVYRVNIPIPEMPFLKSIEYIEDKEKRVYPTLLNPRFFAYLFHPVEVFILLVISNKKYDLFIAQSALLALVGILLKIFRRCRVVVYYSHGFDPKRFPNTIVGDFYKFLDFTAAKLADYNWVLGEKMISERESVSIPKSRLFWVPIALSVNKIKSAINPPGNSLLFIGMLTKMNGTLLLPKIVALLKKKIPTIKLDVIGDGPLMTQLQLAIRKLHLKENIALYGLMQFNDFASIMSNHTVGVAPYAVSKHTMLRVSDSMKLRLYWAASLPVVTTKGYPFSREVADNKLGFCAAFTPEDFANKILHILQNKKEGHEIRLRARKYSKRFDQKEILDAVFKKMKKN